MAAIELKSIEKRYGDTVVVRDLSLKIDHGELVVLVGPSGCGKSTLLRIIAGLLEPTAGQVLIDGKDITSRPPGERDISMVFQSYALYPHMSVFENIAFPLRVRRTDDATVTQRVREVADTLGLTELLERRPRDLSGGQRQRVAMGRAVVRQPKAFLFDEPLSNLDAALRGRMRSEIAALHRRLGATMIYVTHDQHEAMTLADRLVLLNAGDIEQQGAPLDLYRAPRTRFVGEFLGSPPMNFLPATAKDGTVVCAEQALAPELVGSLPAALPESLWLGVRAEHFEVRDAKSVIPANAGIQESPSGSAPLDPRVRGDDVSTSEGLAATVEWYERTGSDAFMYARVEESRVVVRTGDISRDYAPGDRVTLVPTAVQLFDGVSATSLQRSRA